MHWNERRKELWGIKKRRVKTQMVADLKTELSDGSTTVFDIQLASLYTPWSQFLGTLQEFFCCRETSLCSKQQLQRNKSSCFVLIPSALLVQLLKVILHKSSQIFSQQSPSKTSVFSPGAQGWWTWTSHFPLGWPLMHFQGCTLSLLSCTERQQALTASLAQRNLNKMAPALGSTKPLKMDRSIYLYICSPGAAGMKLCPSSVWPWLSVRITICFPGWSISLDYPLKWPASWYQLSQNAKVLQGPCKQQQSHSGTELRKRWRLEYNSDLWSNGCFRISKHSYTVGLSVNITAKITHRYVEDR